MTNRVNGLGRRDIGFVLLILAAFWDAAPVGAGIIVSGDLNPAYGGADPWTISASDLRIGDAADGHMDVTLGSSVSDFRAWIAYEAGTTADVDIIGPGSVWTNGQNLYVGQGGDGALRISSGGRVTSFDGMLGFLPGSTGAATVSGADSTWAIDEDLVVGVWGRGELNITGGGQITNEDGYIGGYDGWLVDAEANEIGYDPNGTGEVLVSGAGSSWTNTEWLYVGYAGDANMVIADGGEVTDEYGLVANEPGVEADVTVRGAGSLWTNTHGLGVGMYGDGDLLIENGGRVTSLESGIAVCADSIGTVEVTGADSLWSNTEELGVGIGGDGTLTIADGGRVTNTHAYIGGLDSEAPNIDVAYVLGQTLDGTGAVLVTGDGSRWDSDGFLFVGYTGAGTLDVNDRGLVTSTYGAIGADPNSTGTVTVTDADSRWTMTDDLAIGAFGQGDLTVAAGGLVDANEVYVGGFDVEALGGDANGVPEGTGTVTVTGAGSQLDVDNFLYVGYTGTGALNVNDGGLVTSTYGAVGADPNSTGAVTVTDADSRWTMTGDLAIGAFGQGDLTVSASGVVEANDVYVGGFDLDALGGDADGVPEGTGTATVTGAGSRLDVSESLYVGYSGTGALDVSEGGTVTAADAYIGYLADSTGEATVTGADSLWRTRDLSVGYVGQGDLTISSGAVVDANEIVVGAYNTGTLLVSDGGVLDANAVWIGQAQGLGVGAATVTGAGSRWDANDVYIGPWGQGELTIAAGGQMTNANALVGTFWVGTGIVTVTGADSLWETVGTLDVGYNGTGTMVVSDGGQVTSAVGTIARNLGSEGSVTVTGAGSLWDVDGGLYVGGRADQAGGTGVLDVNDGGAVTADSVRIWDEGTLSGDGTLTATTVTNSGTIAPGNSIGTLTIDGDLTMDPNSTFEVEVDNDGNSDKLVVTGDVDIQGGTVKAVATETLRGTLDYTILDANSVAGTFDTLDTALLSVTVQSAELGYDPDAVTLQITALGFDDLDLFTRNQRAMGAALQSIAIAGGNAVTTALQGVATDQGLRHSYEQLSGHTRPSLAPITAAGTARFMGTVSRRLRTSGIAGLRTSGLLALAGPDAGVGTQAYDRNVNGTDFALGNGTPILSDRPWGVWGKAYGLFGDTDGDPEAPGYNYATYGAAFGLDFQFTETLLLGVTAGHSDGDVDYDDSRNNSDLAATYFGLYGSWETSQRYVDALLTYSDLEHETRRYVDVMSERLDGELDGYAVSGYVETGFDWCRWSGWRLQPLAGLQFSYLQFDEYTETGGSGALSYDEQSYESYKSSLGMKFTKELSDEIAKRRLTMQVRARWQHEFGDTESIVDTYFATDPTTVFAIRDDEIDRDSAVLGVGLGAELGRGLRLHADYDIRANADAMAHLVSAGLMYRW